MNSLSTFLEESVSLHYRFDLSVYIGENINGIIYLASVSSCLSIDLLNARSAHEGAITNEI